ncbi:substrate-binding periplasmic protein [Rhodoferax mekongensis]|uniref:Transporter substrate-binding domain-containing protein n=1 Tax=Rhodoferax mekongensis TaxID=3068341 RepID=A0ABZ0AWW6_9BURK|nr:transporter substrate-binding domain-containing protein [Rhodoferax sp. TBRC 17307]WNO03957.1 transporter substrate-binding domain-containing protein [Rhodoferax sp. TBRC 17307]
MNIFSKKKAFATICGLLSIEVALAADLNVCMIELKPWAFMAGDPQNSRIVGVMADILIEFKKRTGLEFKSRLLPYARLELELERGSCDIALMAWSDRRSNYAFKGTAFMPLEFGVIAKKGVRLRKYEDLSSLNISVTQGLSICPEFDNDTSLKKQLDKDNLTGVRKVEYQRADAVAGSLLTLRYLIQQEGLDYKFGESLMLKRNEFSTAYSKKSLNIDDYKQIDLYFASMQADGTIKRILNSWYGIK